MIYLIQKNTFKPSNFESLVNTLTTMEKEFKIVQSLPFTDDIFEEDGQTVLNLNRTDVFPFGAVKLAAISKKMNWNPGSMLNENHDYTKYKEFYGNNLLNYDSRIVGFNEPFEWFSKSYFIRPCKDSKIFTGKVFTKEEWLTFVENTNKSGHTNNIDNSTLIQIASPKEIYKEVRCWVVGKDIITSSTYSGINSTSRDLDAEDFAQHMIYLHRIAPAFVIDVCLTENGWKIVELNCINCSGFYGADLSKIIISLESYFL